MPTITGSGESLIVIDKSADAVTVVVAVAVSLPVFGSGVVEVTTAELEITVPDATDGVTLTVKVNTLLPGEKLDNEHEIEPVTPTAGVVHVQAPAVASETNVVPVGKASVRVTELALFGPLFVAVIV